MERIAASAQKLRDVLTEVALDYGDVRTQAAERIVQDVNRMTNLVDVPTLKSVDCKPAVYIASSSTVSDAAMLMVRHSTTALLVLDGTSLIRDVIGIFTTKDICTRVIAKGYDPRSCTVARVLTTSPEFARSDLNVSAALRLMYQGHFLNLPVLDDNSNEIVGVVSVLQLTYAALAQLGKREGFTPDSVQKSTLEEVTSRLTEDSTPVWDTFWNSLDKSNDDIQNLESSVSKTPSRSHSPKSTGRRASLNQMLLSNSRKKSNLQRKFSDDNTTLLSPAPKYRRVQSTESLVRMKFYLKRKTVTFKIKDYATNMTDKISMTINDSVSVLDDLKPFELLHQEIAAKFDMTKKHEILYYDNEGDLIVITDEQDLMESISCFEKQGHSTVELILRPKRYSDGIFSAIWRFFSNITWPSFHTFKSPGFLTGVAVLSIGVLVGTTMKPLRSWP
jgi:CBS domain-containing protein